jgi:hypothetical protein
VLFLTSSSSFFQGNNNNVPVLVQWGGEGPGDFNVPIGRKLEELMPRERSLQDGSLRHIVTFQDCVFRDNYVDSSMSFPGIIENSFNSELVISNCLFQNNVFGDDQNPASYGYAIRSFGPISLDSTCFIDNVFLNHGPVLIYGNQYSASNNYVESTQTDLTCEFLALFNEQDDQADDVPTCEMSDADVCAFTQAPTEAPTQGEASPAPSTFFEEEEEEDISITPPTATTTATSANDTSSASTLQQSGILGAVLIWVLYRH